MLRPHPRTEPHPRVAIAAPRRSARGRGFTTLELLIALAVAGLLFAVGAVALRPDPARTVAVRIQALALAARLDALQRGVPTALVFESGPLGSAFVLRRGSDPERIGDLCRSGTPVRREPLPRGVRVTPLRADLVWLPSGYGRDCDGAGVFNGSVRIDGPTRTYMVRVARGGRLRVERTR